MTILSDQHIRWRCTLDATPMISPFEEASRDAWGGSYGISAASYDFRLDGALSIPPKKFCLGATLEKLHMPDNIAAEVMDKSTWARRGLSLFNTFIDPGFRGYVTLEFFNASDETIEIHHGAGVGQFKFSHLSGPSGSPYAGKYQDQDRGPQEAR